MFSLPWVKDVSIVIAGIVALITFWMGIAQYGKQLHQTRVTQFLQMRRRFLEDATFRHLLSLLAANDPSIADESIQDRRNLVGFLEEVALLCNSEVIRVEVANYMFGYYFCMIDHSEPFWSGLDRESPYWDVFRRFVKRLRAVEFTQHTDELKI